MIGRFSRIPGGDVKQAIRIRRYLLASAFSMLYLCALAALSLAGRLPAQVLYEAVVLVLALIVAFFAVFFSGLNLKSRDPSLTASQMLSAVLTMLYVVYRAEATREIFASFLFITFMFGMLRLPSGRLGVLAAVTLTLFGAVIVSHASRAATAETIKRDVAQWLILAITMPWFILIGGYIGRLRTKLAAADTKIEAIEERASRDELTGAYNRRVLTAAIQAEKIRCDRTGAAFSLCIIDIDCFKRINDEIGHLAGDEVLKCFSEALQVQLRAADIFGRYGGDEFVQILTNSSLEGALLDAERIRQVAAALDFSQISAGYRITVSIGVAQYRQGESAMDIFQHADRALYEAKRDGRNRIVAWPA